jgi:hypothetical protein
VHDDGMPDMNEKVLVEALAKRLGSDPETANKWLKAYCEILMAEFKRGNGVSIRGFGRFYLRGGAFKFTPGQRLRAILGWSNTYKGFL